MLEGSNPTFKWTVDDKPFFTYYNTVLNVIYQHAAIYKLTVSFCYSHVEILIIFIIFICDWFVFDIQRYKWALSSCCNVM